MVVEFLVASQRRASFARKVVGSQTPVMLQSQPVQPLQNLCCVRGRAAHPSWGTGWSGGNLGSLLPSCPHIYLATQVQILLERESS